MCGLAGYLNGTIDFSPKLMGDKLSHRGPDAYGHVSLRDDSLHLVHRRLSIIDLNETGNQPMCSHHGRWWMVYNGEIYNFGELKKELGRQGWRGSSDSEVILQGFEQWGFETTIKKLTGMFAIAAYDKLEDKLYLCRDRFGEKPLYYSHRDSFFIFASELKSLFVHPSLPPKINRQALRSYFAFNCIPAPSTIYQDVYKLEPATILELHLSTNQIKKNKYWKPFLPREEFKGSYSEALIEVERALIKSISGQMISDVPLGAFLSGGIDSSLIVALMQQNSTSKIKTFTIGFEEKHYDEAPFAKKVACYLGTDHTELYISSQKALDIIPDLANIYDEPFSDSSQIPTLLMCQLTKKYVTVALSGDAGDEVFGGYNRYLLGPKIAKMPRMFKLAGSKLLSSLPNNVAVNIFGLIHDKKEKLISAMRAPTEEELYRTLITHWKTDESIVTGEKEINYNEWFSDLDFVHSMMLSDISMYLPDDILVKVDRAAMSVSLETRAPFLDHKLAELAWSLPLDFKIFEGKGKRILRDILYKNVPQHLVDRPKSGFSVPLDSWLRNELKEWAFDLLNPQKIEFQGLLDSKSIMKKWDKHQNGSENWQYHLWDVLMFQSWYETNLKS